MGTHIRILAVLQIIYASIGLAIGMGIFALFGGIAALVGFTAPWSDLVVAVPVLTLIGAAASSFLIVMSLPRLLAGIGLLRLRPWGRVLTIVVSVLGALDFPVGTALGVYGLWVMTHRDAAALLDAEPAFVETPAASR